MTRFSETNKWSDPWFISLTGPQKILFLYVIDVCNNAGFWEENKPMMMLQTGLAEQHLEGAWKGLGRGLVRKDGWVWVRRFLKHQKNEPINPENKAHKQIIRLIAEQSERFREVEGFSAFEGASKGLPSPTGTVQVQVKGGAGENGSAEWMPESLRGDDDFKAVWAAFCSHRAERHEPMTSSARRGLLSKLERYGPDVSADALNEAITNSWKNPVLPDERHSARKNGGDL